MTELPAEHKGRRVVGVRSVAEWHDWLLAEGETSAGVWITVWKQAAAPELPRYEELVQEAVCHGWIDSTVNAFDETSYLMLVAPRKVGSGWSRSNKERIEALEAAGRMTDAGRRVIERAQADGSWTLLDDVEALVVPDDLAAALAAAGLRERWNAWGTGKRKLALTQLVLARTAATRTKRLDRTIAELRDG
ncbi:MAG: YdeI/OmpD-associated family protein [Microthrixaceae bacterium]